MKLLFNNGNNLLLNIIVCFILILKIINIYTNFKNIIPNLLLKKFHSKNFTSYFLVLVI